MPPTGGRRIIPHLRDFSHYRGNSLDELIVRAFGLVLRRLRKERGLSQEALGFEADLQRKHISALELGEKQPTITSVFKLAVALKIKPGKLVALVDSEIAERPESKLKF